LSFLTGINDTRGNHKEEELHSYGTVCGGCARKGRLPPIKRRNKSSVYVATIEKANMLINSLIEQGRIDELGIIVVDEAGLLHMLGEGSRGAIIEQALTKFMHRGSGQVVGMSATLANINEVAQFLHASVPKIIGFVSLFNSGEVYFVYLAFKVFIFSSICLERAPVERLLNKRLRSSCTEVCFELYFHRTF
uniref:Helicase ATP-binding domain-containing protein n=1 Tax=Ascaris lumbricoides TaxID=6252 RepID=A0A0M3IUD3_ASCLU